MRLKNSSLIRSGVLVVVLVVVLFGFFASYAVFQLSYNNLLNNRKMGLRDTTVQETHLLEYAFFKAQSIAKASALKEPIIRYIETVRPGERAAISELLDNYNIGGEYLALYFMDTSGTALASTEKSFIGQNYSLRGYFKTAMSGDFGVEMSIGLTTKLPGYFFSAPVYSSKKNIIGVFVAKLNPDLISTMITRDQANEFKGMTMLADKDGVILYAEKPERIYKSLGPLSPEVNAKIVEGARFSNIHIEPIQYGVVKTELEHYSTPKTIEFFDVEDKENEIVSIAKIGDYPFFLMIEADTKTLQTEAAIEAFFLAFFILLSAIISAVGIGMLLYHFLRPIKEFVSLAKKMSTGDFTGRIGSQKSSELAELRDAFNAMADDLQKFYSELESRVKSATTQLSEEKTVAEQLADDLKKFKLAADNASDQIVITDPEGLVIYGNKAIEKITGYRLEDAIGKKAGILWKKPMDQKYYENLWKIIKTDKKVFISDITNRRKNGMEYEAILNISPILGKNGELLYFVGMEKDVTKEKELDKAKDEFISLASHQLKNPITAISWNLEMLLDGDEGPLNKGQQSVLEKMNESSKNMSELVSGFLDITKIESSGFILERGDVDLLRISDSVLGELAKQISEKKISVIKKYGSNVPHLAIGTKTARIILQNLLTNAIKYTPEHGTVEATIEKTGEGVSIAIKDSGYGIPEDAKSRIFTKLFRADNVKEKEPSGTGLGLYLLKSLVEKLGGKVWFESKEGLGTTFYVHLK